mmetsp:Transcript_7842/g.16157  ORF Transcript_7842/g.16157 Transcript_7842/m.16157 type:complete len:246 (+) Transcript_7842:1197-1934(+)
MQEYVSKGLAKGVSGDLLVDFHHEEGCRQDGRRHASHRSRHRNAAKGIPREVLPVHDSASGVLPLVEEPPRRIVGRKVDALDHSDRHERSRYAGVEGTNGPDHRQRGFSDHSCRGKGGVAAAAVAAAVPRVGDGRRGIAPPGAGNLGRLLRNVAAGAVLRGFVLREMLPSLFLFFQVFVLAERVGLDPNLQAVEGVTNDGSRGSRQVSGEHGVCRVCFRIRIAWVATIDIRDTGISIGTSVLGSN